ncbi:hypothetical protein Tdes44962_MAKER03191 [Teratosphaeria destructans]|uniref:Uncharacterized protein n=1 Tax=Teratosphaeria destructans TaxID=418781 RepID=A0A9W7W224_9PEZI|nr:hypothetical protein Tdes44962_MAKER03191 [Teratosphaeria destructans]
MTLEPQEQGFGTAAVAEQQQQQQHQDGTSQQSSTQPALPRRLRYCEAAGPKTAYRLFPAVEPTPPSSPASFQRASLHKAAADLRRECSSNAPDPARERWTLLSRNIGARPSQTFGSLGRKASVSEMQPIQEQSLLRSPLLPSRRTYPPAEAPKADITGHGRSTSACTERTGSNLSSASNMTSTWQNRVAASASSSQTLLLHGLGLTLTPQDESSGAKKRMRSKPNLRVDVRKSNKDSPPPPPPPPKSPRPERRTSDASQTSSVDSAASLKTTHTCAPISTAQSMAYQPARPTFVHSIASPRSSPSVDSVPVVPALPFRSAEHRIEDVLKSPDTDHGPPVKKIILPKPAGPQAPPSTPSSAQQEFGMRAAWNKFSNIASPRSVRSAEGERTPKASQLWRLGPSQASLMQISDIKERQTTVQTPATEYVSSQTPRKDSLIQRKSDDPSEGPSSTPAKHPDGPPPPPTPSKDAHFMPLSPRPTMTPAMVSPLFEAPRGSASPQPPLASVISQPPSRDAPKPHAATESVLRPRVVDKGPTPDLPVRATTPASDGSRVDPSAQLSNLTKQTEALHKRYATLRSDRQMLQSNIVASLKEQRAGPELASILLDQHLELTAINSSMDICFAKMKSLECKKEEAMAAIIAQHKALHKTDATARRRASHKTRSVISPLSETSGRRTPDMNLDVRSSMHQRSSSRRRIAPPLPKPGRADNEPLPALERQGTRSTNRHTVIRATRQSTDVVVGEDFAAEPDQLSRAPQGTEVESKKIHINGVKAVQLLGLVREVANDQSGADARTSPPELVKSALTAAATQQPLIEVHIPTSPHTVLPSTILSNPNHNKTLPTPPSSAKHHHSTPSDASTTASTASSSAQSSAAEPSTATTSRTSSTSHSPLELTREDYEGELMECRTRESRTVGKLMRGKSVHTIQVYVDDDILEDYEQNEILDYYGGVMSAGRRPRTGRG